MISWWTIINARTEYYNNPFANAFVTGNGKTEFLCSFANWLETWSRTSCSLFSLLKQTLDTLIRTLRAQSSLVSELYAEGFTFVIPRRFQNDPLEKCFAQYPQMSGGPFLVNLR